MSPCPNISCRCCWNVCPPRPPNTYDSIIEACAVCSPISLMVGDMCSSTVLGHETMPIHLIETLLHCDHPTAIMIGTHMWWDMRSLTPVSSRCCWQRRRPSAYAAACSVGTQGSGMTRALSRAAYIALGCATLTVTCKRTCVGDCTEGRGFSGWEVVDAWCSEGVGLRHNYCTMGRMSRHGTPYTSMRAPCSHTSMRKLVGAHLELGSLAIRLGRGQDDGAPVKRRLCRRPAPGGAVPAGGKRGGPCKHSLSTQCDAGGSAVVKVVAMIILGGLCRGWVQVCPDMDVLTHVQPQARHSVAHLTQPTSTPLLTCTAAAGWLRQADCPQTCAPAAAAPAAAAARPACPCCWGCSSHGGGCPACALSSSGSQGRC